MSAMLAWKLIRPNGRRAKCLLSGVAGHFTLILWNGSSLVLWERHPTLDAARRRARELWDLLMAPTPTPALTPG